MARLSLLKSQLFAISLVAIATVLFSTQVHAQATTSSIRVEVTDESGSRVGGVPITVTHIPTGRVISVTANDSGIATLRGLAVGGPYEVSIPPGADYAANRVTDIILKLDETEVVPLAARAATLEEIVVTAEMVSEEQIIGVGRDFDRSTIDGTPSLSRDFVSTLATDSKILVDPSVARGPAVSLAGANFRFNSVTIDGVPQNDNFGLSKNASATQRTPISIDAIEAINVNIAPYDVTYGNFIGGNINIVTKSGTNDFEGSAYYFRTDDSMTGDKSDGEELRIGDFSEDYYGFTFGGPIIRDTLFFFVNYEKFETTRPSNTQTIENIAGVTQADVDRAISIFQNEYGFDPGTFDATDDDQDEKMLIKLDWNINEDHRAAFTYSLADGDVIFDDFPETAALFSNKYNINEKLTAYSLRLFSQWTDTFSTSFKYGIKDVENRQISALDPGTTPHFEINLPTGGIIKAGNDVFRHTNELDNESELFKLAADWQVGDHLITGGWEREEYTVRNAFIPGSRGWWFYSGLDNLENRVVDTVLYGNSNAPDADPALATVNFSLAVDSLFLQDEWLVTDDFTLKFGVRFDTYSNDDVVPLNTAFEARNNFNNQENLDGKDLLAPRIGFDWRPTDRLTLRGGAGLFGGGTPIIMLSNSYAGNGRTRTFLQFLAPFFSPDHAAAINAAALELPDPTAAFRYLHQFIGPTGNPAFDQAAVEAISPDFDILSYWKYSLGAEYVFGDDWIVSADIIRSEANNAYDVTESRRSVIGQAPDGRPIYTTDFDGGDYIITNTDEGSGTIISLALSKFLDTEFGYFDFNLGYTWQDVEETRSYNRFVTYETYAFDPQVDKENPNLAPSRYQVEHRITANMIWSKELFGDNTTTVGLTYAGRSGRLFSYVLGSQGIPTFGGSTLAEFFAEGDNPGSQLFYVPTGINDPIVTGDAQYLQDLNTFIDNEGCLSGNRGQIVNRFNCETDWINIFSLRLQQEIKVGRTAFDLFLDIENLGNLLNSDWGRVDSYTAPSNVVPANVAIDNTDPANPVYVYSPSASYVPGQPETIVAKPAIARIASAYRLQLGVRFRF